MGEGGGGVGGGDEDGEDSASDSAPDVPGHDRESSSASSSSSPVSNLDHIVFLSLEHSPKSYPELSLKSRQGNKHELPGEKASKAEGDRRGILRRKLRSL